MLNLSELSLKEHYALPLRGNNINKMIDAATPLLGMILRLKEINADTMPDKLYSQVVTDIQSAEQLLREEHYESGVIVSFRYVLCTFIDEIALAHGWGSSNSWLNKSLLAHFHTETWGGEKVYILLDKLMSEPRRYKDILEFMYLCFALGFRGRYKINNHNGEFEAIFKRLYDLLLTLKDNKSSSIVLYQTDEQGGSAYALAKKLTARKIFIIASCVLAIIYAIYFFKLEYQSDVILEQLNNLLN